MHLVERIRAVWELRGLSDRKLAGLSELSRSFIWDLRKKTRDISNTTQTALARALRIPLSVLHNDDLWAARLPKYIVAKAELDAYIAATDVSPRLQSSLIEALEKGKAYFLEREGWAQLHETLKLHETRGPRLAALSPNVAEAADRYRTRRKSGPSRQRRAKTT
jgi:transcriptional regulator with XRE-family HTH domain